MSNKGITTSEPIITIDHWELGRGAWRWNSEEQALFFHGLATAASNAPGVDRAMQLQYVAEAMSSNHAYVDAVEFIKDLAERLDAS